MNDLNLLDWEKWQFNLLNRPDIRKGFKPIEFDYLLAIAVHQAPYSFWISELKFNRKLIYRGLIIQLFQHLLVQYPFTKPSVVVIPIPLHNNRWLTRGYNQAAILAKPISQLLNADYSEKLAIREKSTQAQTKLNSTHRRHNMRDAFKITGDVKGKDILIVDDVITTGTTVNSLSRLLKQQGAKQVGVLTVTIAVKP